MIIERGQLIDKVLLSKFLGWEDIKKETQEKTRKEYFGRTIGSPLSSRMIGLAMDDLDFLNVDTRFIITLDELYATVRKINDSIKYMHELTYGICALDNPKQYIDVLRNAEMDLNKDTERINKLISDCLNDIEGEINRFSRRAPVR